MRLSILVSYALSSSIAAALLAACGGSQSPIGTPGAVPQSRATRNQALLYVVASNGYVNFVTYPGGKG